MTYLLPVLEPTYTTESIKIHNYVLRVIRSLSITLLHIYAFTQWNSQDAANLPCTMAHFMYAIFFKTAVCTLVKLYQMYRRNLKKIATFFQTSREVLLTVELLRVLSMEYKNESIMGISNFMSFCSHAYNLSPKSLNGFS